MKRRIHFSFLIIIVALSALARATMVRYSCNQSQLLSLKLPFPVPTGKELLIEGVLTGEFTAAQLTPPGITLFENATLADFNLSVGRGQGTLIISFRIGGTAREFYSFQYPQVEYFVECPEDDPATSTFWQINSGWIVPLLIAFSCVVVIAIMWWRRRMLAKAAITSIYAMRRAVASVVQMTGHEIRADNVEMSDDAQSAVTSLRLGVFNAHVADVAHPGNLPQLNFDKNQLERTFQSLSDSNSVPHALQTPLNGSQEWLMDDSSPLRSGVGVNLNALSASQATIHGSLPNQMPDADPAPATLDDSLSSKPVTDSMFDGTN